MLGGDDDDLGKNALDGVRIEEGRCSVVCARKGGGVVEGRRADVRKRPRPWRWVAMTTTRGGKYAFDGVPGQQEKGSITNEASDVLVLLLSRIFFQGCERVRLCVGHILSGEKLERVLIQVMIMIMLG